MTINVKTLELILREKGFSQKALSDRAGVSAKTISRIIAGGGRNSNKNTTAKIAKALGVSPEELAASPTDKELREIKAKLRAFVSSRTIIDLNGQTNIHFDLVAARYGISPQAQIEAAPLLFTILAEMSFADRRKRLAVFRAAQNSAWNLHPQHLQRGIEILDYRMECLLDKEEKSIKAKDLSGATINGEDESQDWWVEDEGDLFVGFLDRLGRQMDNDLIDVEGGTATNLEYSVLRADLSRITGDDEFASEALRLGRVRVRDIPTNLLGEEMADARIVWLADHLTTNDRAALEELTASRSSSSSTWVTPIQREHRNEQ